MRPWHRLAQVPDHCTRNAREAVRTRGAMRWHLCRPVPSRSLEPFGRSGALLAKPLILAIFFAENCGEGQLRGRPSSRKGGAGFQNTRSSPSNRRGRPRVAARNSNRGLTLSSGFCCDIVSCNGSPSLVQRGCSDSSRSSTRRTVTCSKGERYRLGSAGRVDGIVGIPPYASWPRSTWKCYRWLPVAKWPG